MIFTKDFALMSWQGLYASGILENKYSTKFPNKVGETAGTSKKKKQKQNNPKPSL